MKALLASLLLISLSAFSYEYSFDSDYCDIDINGGVRISLSEIEFYKNDHLLYKIINNNELVVNDTVITLDDNQQKLVSIYSNKIHTLILKVKNLATDVLSLASDALRLAFNELLGLENTVGEDLKIHFDEISTEIDKRFVTDQTIYFDESGFSDNNFFGKDFEQRIENAVKATVQNLWGVL